MLRVLGMGRMAPKVTEQDEVDLVGAVADVPKKDHATRRGTMETTPQRFQRHIQTHPLRALREKDHQLRILEVGAGAGAAATGMQGGERLQPVDSGLLLVSRGPLGVI